MASDKQAATPIRIGETIRIGDHDLAAKPIFAAQPEGDGLTAVTLTLYTTDLTIDWSALRPGTEVMAPESIWAEREWTIRNHDKKETP